MDIDAAIACKNSSCVRRATSKLASGGIAVVVMENSAHYITAMDRSLVGRFTLISFGETLP